MEANSLTLEKPKSKKTDSIFLKKVRKVIREVLAIIFWMYTIIKLFFFDIDVLIVNNFFPGNAWVIKFKFIILISLITAFWLVTKNSRVVNWTLYVVFYPFIVFFWYVPVFIVNRKNWNLAFAIINSIISFFRSFKYNFISGTVYLICLVSIYFVSNQLFLWVCVCTAFLILAISYVRRFIYVFKPSSIFQVHAKIFSGIRKNGKASFALTDDIRGLPIEQLSKYQLEKRTTNLQMSVLFNRVCLFVAKKLKSYQNSGFNIISYVLTILGLILLTVVTFAFIYYALYKLNPLWFNSHGEPRFFYFLYFSFNNLLFNSISELNVAAPVSQSVYMIQQTFSFFLVAIFVSLYFSIKHQRHSDELNIVIENIAKEGEMMEAFIQEEYKLKNINEAISELEKLKSSLSKIIYQMSKYIN